MGLTYVKVSELIGNKNQIPVKTFNNQFGFFDPANSTKGSTEWNHWNGTSFKCELLSFIIKIVSFNDR